MKGFDVPREDERLVPRVLPALANRLELLE